MAGRRGKRLDRATCHHTYTTSKTSRGKERGKGKGKGGGKTTVLSSPCKSRESPGAPRGGGQFDFAPICVCNSGPQTRYSEQRIPMAKDKILGLTMQCACIALYVLTDPREHLCALACPVDLVLNYALKQCEDASKQHRVKQNRDRSSTENLEIHR